MTDDQRFASRRPDVLTYQTEPLEEDVTVRPALSPKLKIASSGTDSDFVVKLNLTSTLIIIPIRKWPMPARESLDRRRFVWEAISSFCAANQCAQNSATAGRSRSRWCPENPRTKLNSIPDLDHTFRKARIMVPIRSSWFPLVTATRRRLWRSLTRSRKIQESQIAGLSQ